MFPPKYYLALIHQGTDDFKVSFPDFPDCVAAGKVLEEVKTSARKALRLTIQSALAAGKELPEPTEVNKAAELVTKAGALCAIMVIPE